jgi:DNA-binding transcriptional regulator GbsR (MarR family)
MTLEPELVLRKKRYEQGINQGFHDPVKSFYQFNLNFEVQRQYAKVDPRMKSIRDAKIKFEAASHYSLQLAQSPEGEYSELEHTKFDRFDGD